MGVSQTSAWGLPPAKLHQREWHRCTRSARRRRPSAAPRSDWPIYSTAPPARAVPRCGRNAGYVRQASSRGELQVLIAEDDQAIAEMYRLKLECEGWTVR